MQVIKFYKDDSTVEDVLHQLQFWKRQVKFMDDNINHPKHYTAHPSGIECIDVAEHMGFNLGNAIKYIWRAGLKDGTIDGHLNDLKKAKWYLEREIFNLCREK